MPIIRAMTPKDLTFVSAIERREQIAPWERAIFLHCLWLNYRCRVLIEKRTIIGYCISRTQFNSCHLLNLVIDQPFQRKGYARLLLEDLISEVKLMADIDSVILEVRPSNKAAIELYHQFGFNQTGIKPDYYQDENHCEDALMLSLKIDRE